MLQLFVQSKDELGKRQALSRVSLGVRVEGMKNDGKEVGYVIWKRLYNGPDA